MHLSVDLYGVDREFSESKQNIEDLLELLVREIDMHQILPIQSIEYKGRKLEDNGVTAVVVIAESNIAIHTFPHHGLVNVDIFSCKKFDYVKSLEILRESFSSKICKFCLLNRGLEFDQDVKLFSFEETLS